MQTEEKRGKDEKAKLHQQLTDLKASLQVREQAEADMQVSAPPTNERRRRHWWSTSRSSAANPAGFTWALRSMCCRGCVCACVVQSELNLLTEQLNTLKQNLANKESQLVEVQAKSKGSESNTQSLKDQIKELQVRAPRTAQTRGS